MLIPVALFILGLVLLVKFGNEAVNRALHLSRLTGLSHVAIGFLILAVGTSTPELAVSVISAFENQTSLAFGNIVGSSIIDMTLIFGITAIVGTIVFSKRDVETSHALVLTSLIALFALVFGGISRIFGIFCLIAFGMFSYILIKERYVIGGEERPWLKTPEIVKHLFMLAIAITVIIIGAKLLVYSSIEIANILLISTAFIGATIISIGTTTPELAVSLAAIRKRKSSLAVGNIIGSTITNLGLIMGLVGIIAPFTFNSIERISLIALFSISILLILMAERAKFGKAEGAILIFTYIIFLIYISNYE